MWYYSLLLLLIHFCFAQKETADTFPNPRTNGYNECGLKSKGYVCDPDKQLTEQERYRLNNDLLQLSRRTSDDQSTDFCTTKGVDATLFITKQGSEQLARDLNTLWAIDRQCKKSIVFVLSANNHNLYYAADQLSPISTSNFEKVINEEQHLLNEGKFMMALTTIFSKLGGSIQDNNRERMKTNDSTLESGTSMGIQQISSLSYVVMISSIALYLFVA